MFVVRQHQLVKAGMQVVDDTVAMPAMELLGYSMSEQLESSLPAQYFKLTRLGADFFLDVSLPEDAVTLFNQGVSVWGVIIAK
jgi:hypothetical protein